MFKQFLAGGQVPAEVMFLMVAPVVLLIYFFAVWDSHRKAAQGKGVDGQIGFKVALAAFGFLGLMLLLANLQIFLTMLLTFHFRKILQPIPGILVGGGVLFLLWQKVVPQTNYREENKVFRLTAGAVAIFAGTWLILFLHHALGGLLAWQGWRHLAYNLSGVLVYAPFALLSAMFLSREVGVKGVADSLQSVVKQVPLGQKRSTDTDPTAKPAVSPAAAAPVAPAYPPSAFVTPERPATSMSSPSPAAAPTSSPFVNPSVPSAPPAVPGTGYPGGGQGTGGTP